MTMKIVILLWGAGMAATTVVNFLAASIHGTASNATLTKSLHEALVSRTIYYKQYQCSGPESDHSKCVPLFNKLRVKEATHDMEFS
uniref:Uncharacterized protein n=1 Tax=Physcomitrium patens TaxID=3218 RepID=A0A2K1KX90_PHYPA|nr:hypothetical protein PHYPA_005399 [Physcomitrium patens]